MPFTMWNIQFLNKITSVVHSVMIHDQLFLPGTVHWIPWHFVFRTAPLVVAYPLRITSTVTPVLTYLVPCSFVSVLFVGG
jgi:hypothetical protein